MFALNHLLLLGVLEMKLLLEMLKAATAYAGDEIALGEMDLSMVGRLSITELQTLQHQVGDLHQTCRSLIEKIRHAEVKE